MVSTSIKTIIAIVSLGIGVFTFFYFDDMVYAAIIAVCLIFVFLFIGKYEKEKKKEEDIAVNANIAVQKEVVNTEIVQPAQNNPENAETTTQNVQMNNETGIEQKTD